jgi:hypothetical protein
MGPMTYERTKVAPWEKWTDGEWHDIRTGPAGEAREESLRQYRRHWDSMRAWADSNGYRGQIHRRENGRLLSVRFTRPTPAADARHLAPLTRNELGRNLLTALKLLDCAMQLRVHGEQAPGGDETWATFDRNAEAFLRKIRNVSTSAEEIR